MKKATKVMYTVGNIINILGIIFISLAILCAICGIAFSQEIFEQMTEKDLTHFNTAADIRISSISMLIGCVIGLIVAIVMLVLATKARKAIQNDDKNDTPHIVMIVIGVFGNVFYLLCGIFGLIAQNQDKKQAK